MDIRCANVIGISTRRSMFLIDGSPSGADALQRVQTATGTCRPVAGPPRSGCASSWPWQTRCCTAPPCAAGHVQVTCTVLLQVPNQPIVFSADPTHMARSEDDIIAFTWWHYIVVNSSQSFWPLHLPMTKVCTPRFIVPSLAPGGRARHGHADGLPRPHQGPQSSFVAALTAAGADSEPVRCARRVEAWLDVVADRRS